MVEGVRGPIKSQYEVKGDDIRGVPQFPGHKLQKFKGSSYDVEAKIRQLYTAVNKMDDQYYTLVEMYNKHVATFNTTYGGNNAGSTKAQQMRKIANEWFGTADWLLNRNVQLTNFICKLLYNI